MTAISTRFVPPTLTLRDPGRNPKGFQKADPERRGPFDSWTVTTGLAAGSLAFLLVIALRHFLAFSGLKVLLITFVLMLTVPTSRLLSRRLFFSAVALAGFTPLLWWLPLTNLGLDQGTLIFALVAGGTVGCMCNALISRRFLTWFVPEFHVVDVLPLGAGVAATATAVNFFAVDTFKQ